MLFRDKIDLITTTPTVNTAGNTVNAKKYRSVYANEKSIRQSEFYQAAVTDLRPQLMFEMRVKEYADESLLRYKDQEYRIIRTYKKDRTFMEIVCQGVVNNGK